MRTFEEFSGAILREWDETAPSYVKASVRPLFGEIRYLYEHGVSVDDFRERLEMAFTNATITKRRALAYTIATYRRSERH